MLQPQQQRYFVSLTNKNQIPILKLSNNNQPGINNNDKNEGTMMVMTMTTTAMTALLLLLEGQRTGDSIHDCNDHCATGISTPSPQVKGRLIKPQTLTMMSKQ